MTSYSASQSSLDLNSRQFSLPSSYDHELKIQKARENARRAEKEKEAERHELMMHDFLVREQSNPQTLTLF